MRSQVFVSNALRKEVAPKEVAEYIEGRIRYAAQMLGWSFNRTNDLWRCDRGYSRQYRPTPDEILDIENYTGLKYAQEQVAEVDALISRAAALQNSQDSDFHSEFIAAIRTISRFMDRT